MCGQVDGKGPCDSTTGAAVCQSGVCNAKLGRASRRPPGRASRTWTARRGRSALRPRSPVRRSSRRRRPSRRTERTAGCVTRPQLALSVPPGSATRKRTPAPARKARPAR
jgi:hypothetical protein